MPAAKRKKARRKPAKAQKSKTKSRKKASDSNVGRPKIMDDPVVKSITLDSSEWEEIYENCPEEKASWAHRIRALLKRRTRRKK